MISNMLCPRFMISRMQVDLRFFSRIGCDHNVKVNPARFAKLAVNVFGVAPEGKTEEEIAFEGIERLRSFWTSIGAPKTLADYDIDDSKLELMAEKATVNGPLGNFGNLDKDDVLSILKASL